MFIIDNWGFFIFLFIIIFILFYNQQNTCSNIGKYIFNNMNTENFDNYEKFNISDVNYLDSNARKKDYLQLQTTKKRYELPFNINNEGYVAFGHTPYAPIQSMPTLNFHSSYGPEKDKWC